MNFRRLTDKGDGVYINSTKSFNPIGGFKEETIDKVFNFAYDMTFGGKGSHKAKRSGGTIKRTELKIFINAFQGKLAEFATCNIFWKFFGIKLPHPDLETYKLGKWDRFDFEYRDKIISVKSTKYFGNLLLLEAEDWSLNGEYLPNKNLANSGKCDFTILIRIKPNGEKLFNDESSLWYKETLYNKIKEQEWEYDVVGYITHEELVYLIQQGYIIEKGSLLNGKHPMDARNYYAQAGDMHPIESLKTGLIGGGY